MADFLTIGGVPYPVQTSGASQGSHEYSGERVRAFANNMRSTRGDKKRQWSFVIGPISIAQLTTLLAAVDNDAVVNFAGDAIGATVACMADVTEGPYVPDGSTTHKRVAHVAAYEV